MMTGAVLEQLWDEIFLCYMEARAQGVAGVVEELHKALLSLERVQAQVFGGKRVRQECRAR